MGLLTDSERGSWTYIDTKRPHTHDVRMLVLVQRSGAPPLLLSGGNDAQLIAYNANALLKASTPLHGDVGGVCTMVCIHSVTVPWLNTAFVRALLVT